MNFFDNLKVIFSKEGQENIKAFNDREKEEALIAQKEILARRADPKKMREYEEKSDANRRKLAEERAVYKFQGVVKEGTLDMLARLSWKTTFSRSIRLEYNFILFYLGYDPLEDWQRLKSEGKIKMGKDLERDVKSSRLGSEGLLEVRVDERMPYIDQGYVDEDSDVMGKFMGMFNKKDKEKKEKE